MSQTKEHLFLYSPIAGRSPIPRHLSPLAGIILDRLFLGHNLLTGHIPTFVEGMQIGTLDFSSNYLSGVRPGGGKGRASDQYGGGQVLISRSEVFLSAATKRLPVIECPDKRSLPIKRQASLLHSPPIFPSLTPADLAARPLPTATHPPHVLPGPLPPGLGLIGGLFSLQLDTNRLTGPIPPLYLSFNLDILLLNDNDLSGTLPPSIVWAQDLLWLDVSLNARMT